VWEGEGRGGGVGRGGGEKKQDEWERIVAGVWKNNMKEDEADTQRISSFVGIKVDGVIKKKSGSNK